MQGWFYLLAGQVFLQIEVMLICTGDLRIMSNPEHLFGESLAHSITCNVANIVLWL